MAEIYLESHNVIELNGLKDYVTGNYLSGATVNMYMGAGADGKGLLGPLAMTYVTGSDGKYRITLTDVQIVALAAGINYTIRIEADNGGVKAVFFKNVTAKVRAL